MHGVLPTVLINLTSFSCGRCLRSDYGRISNIDYVNDGKNGWANKRSLRDMKENIDEDLEAISFPIYGKMEMRTYLNNNIFVPVVKHPGVVFFTVKESISQQVDYMLEAVAGVWPIFIVNIVLIMLSGLIIWSLVSTFIYYIIIKLNRWPNPSLNKYRILTFLQTLWGTRDSDFL